MLLLLLRQDMCPCPLDIWTKLLRQLLLQEGQRSLHSLHQSRHEILLTVQLVLQRHVLVLQVRQLLRLLQPLLYGWPELPLQRSDLRLLKLYGIDLLLDRLLGLCAPYRQCLQLLDLFQGNALDIAHHGFFRLNSLQIQRYLFRCL